MSVFSDLYLDLEQMGERQKDFKQSILLAEYTFQYLEEHFLLLYFCYMEHPSKPKCVLPTSVSSNLIFIRLFNFFLAPEIMSSREHNALPLWDKTCPLSRNALSKSPLKALSKIKSLIKFWFLSLVCKVGHCFQFFDFESPF